MSARLGLEATTHIAEQNNILSLPPLCLLFSYGRRLEDEWVFFKQKIVITILSTQTKTSRFRLPFFPLPRLVNCGKYEKHEFCEMSSRYVLLTFVRQAGAP